MPRDTKEPQSYGSDTDWVSGHTGQRVHDQKSEPPPEHRDFYDDRRESESTSASQGGLTSDVQLADSAQAAGPTSDESSTPVQKVTATETGAKRDSYFRKRDYDGE